MALKTYSNSEQSIKGPLSKRENLKKNSFGLTGLKIAVLIVATLITWIGSAHSANLTLRWDPPPEGNISGYNLYYGTNKNSFDHSIKGVKKTECTAWNLQPCLTYYFAVTAYNQTGESDYSNEVSYMARPSNDTDTDKDGIPDTCELNTYGTDPNKADTDGDGLSDGAELIFWEDRWDDDLDGDSLVNLLDWDADGDGFSDGEEKTAKFDPDDPASKPALLPIEIGEVGVNQNWTWVAFKRKFHTPVVVAGGMSSNGVQPAVVRIRNVNQAGFEISVQEWDYMDGQHATESIGYLALEAGVYQLPGGLEIEADIFETDTTDAFDTFYFRHQFKVPPVVISSVTTFWGAQAVTTRLKNINKIGFDLRMQEQEVYPQYHAKEEISYVAWVPSAGNFDGVTFEVGRTPNTITDQDYYLKFSETFCQGSGFSH